MGSSRPTGRRTGGKPIAIKAALKNGVLRVWMPKREEAKPKAIDIAVETKH